MAGQIRIGCSGWNYKHWRELFYPKGMPVRLWFEHYAATFDTVEINNSFYRLPKAETFDKWREQAPPGFCYAVKANRFLTQAKKLKDCAEPLQRMLTPFRHLGDRLGPILYQLPPRLRLNLDRLRDFLDLLPGDLTHVFEFREKSWYTDEVLALLESRSVSFCVHDMPGSQSPRWAAGPIAYVRFHGGEGKYWGRYSDEGLLGWTDWIVEQSRVGRDVWCYFNNDIHAHAIDDALTLRAMVGQAIR
ncbi:MAG TPA: DUF72 domain-containing protein [Allosphingosinicella sp.]|uniref:DUF72 domain-containing protein n=1 Tax=Allosphingosinicella sp. TaxID=2823234 RepID=UPI002ED97858